MKLNSPSAERNRDPILQVLSACIPPQGFLLDIASGSGQHALHFAQNLPEWTVQPTEIDDRSLGSICVYVAENRLPNLRHPARLSATDEDWSAALPESGQVDAVVCINMVHISPWEATLGLVAGAGRVVKPGGVLFLYGPYRVNGAPTTESNAQFEEWLQARDPSYGLRDLETVSQLALDAGFAAEACVSMPANNFGLIFRKT